MSEQDFNKIFSKNLNHYLALNQKSQLDLARYLGVSTSAVSTWCRGLKTPRVDKIDLMCTYFHIKRSDLMQEKNSKQDDAYYLNNETREIAQEIFENPELRSLFDAAKDLPPERLKAHIDFIKTLKEQENKSDDGGC